MDFFAPVEWSSDFVHAHPEPDTIYEKIEGNAYCGKTNAIVPEFIDQAKRHKEGEFNHQQRQQRKIGIEIALPCDQFGDKEKTDIENDQQGGEPREVHPVDIFMDLEMALQDICHWGTPSFSVIRVVVLPTL
jgi:hypothetical protein